MGSAYYAIPWDILKNAVYFSHKWIFPVINSVFDSRVKFFLLFETKISLNFKYYMAQMVKILLAMQETWVQSLDWKDSLKKGVANHASILAWRIPGTRNLVIICPWGHKESHTTK